MRRENKIKNIHRRKRNQKKKVGDYSAQAVINTILSQAFPDDPIVGEEDATDLRLGAPPSNGKDEAEASRSRSRAAAAALCARVVELADDVLAQPPRPRLDIEEEEGGERGEERAEWGLGKRWGADALLKAIDRGNHAGGRRSGRASLCIASPVFFFRFMMNDAPPFFNLLRLLFANVHHTHRHVDT